MEGISGMASTELDPHQLAFLKAIEDLLQSLRNDIVS